MTDPLRIHERVKLRELTLDLRKIKPAVMQEVEAKLGESYQTAAKKGRGVEILWAFAYAVGRRIDPELTWEEAGEIDVTVVHEQIPPTNGNG